MGNFKINHMGICENPETVGVFEDSKEIIRILVAEYRNKWSIGFAYTDKVTNLGYSKFPSFNGCCLYETKRDATIAQINEILQIGTLSRQIRLQLKDGRNTVMFEQLQLFA